MTIAERDTVWILNARSIDRWLLVHHPHIWAARFPNVLLFAGGLAFISGIVSVIVICFMDTIPDLMLGGVAVAYFVVLHEWASMQANRVMPDGPRISRSPGTDAAVGFLAFVTAVIVGAAVFGPLFGVIALERTLEGSEARVRSTVRDLQIGIAYMPERQRYTRQALEKEHLLQYGENSATLRKYALDIIRRKDREQVIADLARFSNALAMTTGDEPKPNVARCAEHLLSIESMPLTFSQKSPNGTAADFVLDEWRRRLSLLTACDYGQLYVSDSSEFWRHWSILKWMTHEKIVSLSVSILLISLWTAVTLACNATYGMYLVFPVGAFGTSFLMFVSDSKLLPTSERHQFSMYTIFALWVLAVAALTAVLILPRLRIIGADLLNTMMLAAIILIIAQFLLPSREIALVYPHAIAVTVFCFLLAPYGNYVRKRAVVGPQT
jgi:hypothetical protein